MIHYYLLSYYSNMTDIHAKQHFLRLEILEAGVDPGEFLQFLVAANSKKGENLEMWSLEELREVVKAFKTSKNLPMLGQQETEKSDPVGKQGKQANIFDDTVYIEQVKCLNKQTNKISACSDLKIKITSFDKNEGGTFQRSYITFRIETPLLGTCVHRRYSDFVWLRDALVNLYPGYPIPPLKKKGNFKRYDDKYLIKKMLILERFLNAIITINELFSQQLFEKFLTVTLPKEFQKLKAKYAKQEKLALNSIRTNSGTITVATETKLSSKIGKYQEYLRQTQPEIKKIYKNFKGVATCFQQANQIFQAISAGCKFMQGKDDAIRGELQLPSIIGDSPLSVLENLTRQYGSQLLEQATSFRKDIYSLMKYESLYRLNVLQSMDELAQKQQAYNQAKATLMKKKEKLYSQGKMEKWCLEVKLSTKPSKQQAMKVILPKETKELLTLRQDYALYNAQIYEQCFRHTKDINKMLSNYIRQFVQLQVSSAAKTSQLFSQICKRTQQISKLFQQ